MSCTNCGAVQDATNRIQKDKRAHELKKLIIVCMAVVLVVLCICGTVLGCYTIKTQQETILEQQYALNMQYASLMEYVAGAEVTTTTETIDGSDGGVAAKIEGDNNSISAGGDN